MGIEVFGGNDLIMPKILPLCTCAKSNLSLGKIEKENLTALPGKDGAQQAYASKAVHSYW